MENVSPTAACSTYCNEVASAMTGTSPPGKGRLRSTQGFARSASLSASDAANVKRPLSMKPGSGATIVGAVGRYRFRQLASSPGRRRKRVKRMRENSGALTTRASRPAASFGLLSIGTSDCAIRAKPPVPE